MFTAPFNLDLYEGDSVTLRHTASQRRFVITVHQDTLSEDPRSNSDHGTIMQTWDLGYYSPDGKHTYAGVPGEYTSRYGRNVDSNRLNKYWTISKYAPSVWGYLSRDSYDGTLSFTPSAEADGHYDGVIVSRDDPDWGTITTETLAAEVAEYNRYATGQIIGVTCEEITTVSVAVTFPPNRISEPVTEERREFVDSLWGIDLGPRDYQTYSHERYLWDVISELLPVPEDFTFPHYYSYDGKPLSTAQYDANIAAFFDHYEEV